MNQESLPIQAESPKKARKARTPKDPNAPRKPRKLSAMQQTVIKHVSGMKGNFSPGDWKQQAKIYSTLSKVYGAEFLLWMPPPEGYKVPSLSHYRSAMGKNYLSDQLVEYVKFKGVSQEKKQDIQLAPAKIGTDIFVSTKPKTLREFLNYGKEIRNTGIAPAVQQQ